MRSSLVICSDKSGVGWVESDIRRTLPKSLVHRLGRIPQQRNLIGSLVILPRRCMRLFGSVLRMSDSTHPTPLLSEHMTRLERIIIQSLEVIYFKTFSLIFTFVPSNPAYPYSENKMISNRSTCSENYAFFYSFTRASIAFYGLFLVVYIILLCIAAIRFFLSKRKSKALLRWWAFPVSIIFAILYVKPCHGSMSSCN